jgi:hypothetical protein
MKKYDINFAEWPYIRTVRAKNFISVQKYAESKGYNFKSITLSYHQ